MLTFKFVKNWYEPLHFNSDDYLRYLKAHVALQAAKVEHQKKIHDLQENLVSILDNVLSVLQNDANTEQPIPNPAPWTCPLKISFEKLTRLKGEHSHRDIDPDELFQPLNECIYRYNFMHQYSIHTYLKSSFYKTLAQLKLTYQPFLQQLIDIEQDLSNYKEKISNCSDELKKMLPVERLRQKLNEEIQISLNKIQQEASSAAKEVSMVDPRYQGYIAIKSLCLALLHYKKLPFLIPNQYSDNLSKHHSFAHFIQKEVENSGWFSEKLLKQNEYVASKINLLKKIVEAHRLNLLRGVLIYQDELHKEIIQQFEQSKSTSLSISDNVIDRSRNKPLPEHPTTKEKVTANAIPQYGELHERLDEEGSSDITYEITPIEKNLFEPKVSLSEKQPAICNPLDSEQQCGSSSEGQQAPTLQTNNINLAPPTPLFAAIGKTSAQTTWIEQQVLSHNNSAPPNGLNNEHPDYPNTDLLVNHEAKLNPCTLLVDNNKRIISGVIANLISNIKHLKRGRATWFHYNKDKKIQQLTLINDWISQAPDFESKQQVTLSLIKAVCETKRNPLGIFAPYSINELNKQIKEVGLAISSSIKFDRKEIEILTNTESISRFFAGYCDDPSSFMVKNFSGSS